MFPLHKFSLIIRKTPLAFLSSNLAYSSTEISSKEIFPAHNSVSKKMYVGERLISVRNVYGANVWSPLKYHEFQASLLL